MLAERSDLSTLIKYLWQEGASLVARFNHATSKKTLISFGNSDLDLIGIIQSKLIVEHLPHDFRKTHSFIYTRNRARQV